jgi:hypothetical protein
MLLLQLLLSLPMVANQSTQLAELLVQFQVELPRVGLPQAELLVQFQVELPRVGLPQAELLAESR